MKALDDFVTRAKSENTEHHNKHASSMQDLSSTVERSFSNISNHFTTTFDRVQDLGDNMETDTGKLKSALVPVEDGICRPLSNLRADINDTVLREYEPTGDTPEKKTYRYPTKLPRTDEPEVLLAGLQDEIPSPVNVYPVAFDNPDSPGVLKSLPQVTSPKSTRSRHTINMSARELGTDLTVGTTTFDGSASTTSIPVTKESATKSLFERIATGTTSMKPPTTRQAKKKAAAFEDIEDEENMPPSRFSQSASRRKSPRFN